MENLLSQTETDGSSFIRVAGSFRDPAGYVVRHDGLYKRVITPHGAAGFDRYIESGLHAELLRDNLVLRHGCEVSGRGRILTPEQLPYISYPYEWCFAQLRDAALLTLEIQERALHCGMSLKDASAFNIQFDGCRPVFIDASSFEEDCGAPWPAYEQFCRHFLAPLLLLEHGVEEAATFFRCVLDGLPLSTASRLLPARSWLRTGALLHIHLHGISSRRGAGGRGTGAMTSSCESRLAIVASLRRAVESLREPGGSSAWLTYREQRPHYSSAAASSKRDLAAGVFEAMRPGMTFDLGANTGEFSEIAATYGRCVAFDSDARCIGRLYAARRAHPGADGWLLPLRMNFSDPSPGLGFAHEERMSLASRADADLTLALGLIHHLRFRERLPFAGMGAYLARFSKRVLLEFVPPEDPMVRALAPHASDLEDYSAAALRRCWRPHFELEWESAIKDSGRTLLLFRRTP